jgi:O-antigen biosynthesis protein
MTMAADRTIFDEPHYESLELLAAVALADGNIGSAFKFADRRCRIPPVPEAHCYVLRGEASYQMGAKVDAITDMVKALDIAPDNIAANRRVLAWANGREQIKAALTLVDHDRDLSLLSKAIKILQEHGHGKFANVTVHDDAIEGWAVWDVNADLEVSITDGTQIASTKFEPTPLHPLAGCGHAVNFSMRRPRSSKLQSILLSLGGNVFRTTRARSNAAKLTNGAYRRVPANTGSQPITVIIPVYGDYETTTLCLEALRDALKPPHHRAIVINDATPDPRIAQYLIETAADGDVKVLINSYNLGFVGSVNRALRHIADGDVIILNSDTVVPPDFIDRLSAAAQSTPEIGTVTPFTNNGEFASFPVPNTTNPLLSREDIKAIDNIAAQVNADRVVDIPSGIGFCLYVTRACLDAVGSLSEDFGRGYLEDADFCLRARERGFRNVCAPSVYVGHAGSKSFGPERRSLIVHNLGVLERRFPAHRSECAAFMAADPLRVAREAIELEATDNATHPRLLVTGAGAVGAVAGERARQLAAAGQQVLVLKVRCTAEGILAEITDAAGGVPQSLRFDITSPSNCKSLFNFLRNVEPAGIEIVDPAHAPFSFVEMLLNLKAPCDIFIADAGLLGPEAAHPCAEAVRSSLAAQSNRRREDINKVDARPSYREWQDFWQEIAADAQEILAPCSHAEAFAATVLPRRTIHRIEPSTSSCHTKKRVDNPVADGRIGFVPARSSLHEQWLMGEVARAFSKTRPDLSISVVGATLDDIGLMQNANTFVTGAVDAEEVERLSASLGLERIFISATRPLFGHPIISAVQSCSLPIAYFDWSKGHRKSDKDDLPINPNASLDELIETLSEWMPQP